MKKGASFLIVMICIAVTSCRHHHGITISFNDSGRFYSMKAWFDRERTRDIEKYMNEKLGDQSNMSFVNSRIDGEISLDDHTNFYIRKYPGYLQIKLDKQQNSDDSYEKVQDMCQGIKQLLAEPGRH